MLCRHGGPWPPLSLRLHRGRLQLWQLRGLRQRAHPNGYVAGPLPAALGGPAASPASGGWFSASEASILRDCASGNRRSLGFRGHLRSSRSPGWLKKSFRPPPGLRGRGELAPQLCAQRPETESILSSSVEKGLKTSLAWMWHLSVKRNGLFFFRESTFIIWSLWRTSEWSYLLLCFLFTGWVYVLVCLCSFYVLVWGCVHPSGSPAYPVLLGFNGGFFTKAWLNINSIFSPSLF